MKKLLFGILIFISTFCFAILVKQNSSSTQTEMKMSNLTNFQNVEIKELYFEAKTYDSKNVQLEAYLFICSVDYYENPKFCISDIEENKSGTMGIVNLRFAEMKPNVFQRQFKINERGVSENRIKVIIKGTSKDYCNPSLNCDAGRLIYIKAQEVIQLEPAEKFEFWNYHF